MSKILISLSSSSDCWCNMLERIVSWKINASYEAIDTDPLTRTFVLLAFWSSPKIAYINEVFPLPVLPTNKTVSPFFISKLMSWSSKLWFMFSLLLSESDLIYGFHLNDPFSTETAILSGVISWSITSIFCSFKCKKFINLFMEIPPTRIVDNWPNYIFLFYLEYCLWYLLT